MILDRFKLDGKVALVTGAGSGLGQAMAGALTEAGALSNPDAEKWLSEKIVLGRVGGPEDIQGACVFLASDASSYITGANIFEDGGGWL